MPLTKPTFSLGTAASHTRTSRLPAAKPSRDRTKRGQHGRNDFRAPLSGQPGKAVGHAVGKLTVRHDLAVRVRIIQTRRTPSGFAGESGKASPRPREGPLAQITPWSGSARICRRIPWLPGAALLVRPYRIKAALGAAGGGPVMGPRTPGASRPTRTPPHPVPTSQKVAQEPQDRPEASPRRLRERTACLTRTDAGVHITAMTATSPTTTASQKTDIGHTTSHDDASTRPATCRRPRRRRREQGSLSVLSFQARCEYDALVTSEPQTGRGSIRQAPSRSSPQTQPGTGAHSVCRRITFVSSALA
jgi:hypothetical protein